MSPEGRRAPAQVHDNIPNYAPNTTNEFGLAPGRRLKMKAAQCALLVVQRKIALDKFRFEAVGGKFPGAKCAREKSAFISMRFKLDDERAGQTCFPKFHGRD